MTIFKALPWSGSDNAPPLNREQRRDVELGGVLTQGDGRTATVTIVDLSYDGCAVRLGVPVAVGDKVELGVAGRGAIQASVRWYNQGEAGLLFETGKPARPHWPRKSERVAVEGEALLRRAGQPARPARLADLSRFGCKCVATDMPAAGERAWVKFPGLEELEASVSWVEGEAVGLVYRNPLHPAVFALQLERFEAARPASGSGRD